MAASISCSSGVERCQGGRKEKQITLVVRIKTDGHTNINDKVCHVTILCYVEFDNVSIALTKS